MGLRDLDLAGAILTIPMAIMRGLSWIWSQIAGAASNWWAVLTDVDFARERLSGWAELTIFAPIRYYVKMVKWALFGSPQEQIYASVILAITLTVASFGFLTIVAAIVFVPLILVGMIRMIPAANGIYDRVTSPLERRSSKSSGWIRNRRD